MKTWADESEDPSPPAPSHTGERPKLNLQPRSRGVDTASPATSSSTTSKSNPFGAAKPREVVLQSKGIDPAAVEKRVERKASVAKLTAEQNRQVEALRIELTEIEEKLRDANENELPEEEYRVAAERKRAELHRLLQEFQSVRLRDDDDNVLPQPAGEEGRKFERPSERRRRLEQQRRGGGGRGFHDESAEEGEDAYSSFGGSRNRYAGRGGGGSGRSQGERRSGGGRGSYRGAGGGYRDREGGYRQERGRGSYGGSGGGGGGAGYDEYDGDRYAGERYNY